MCMEEKKLFAVIQLSDLKWPTLTALPTSRFRLFVAADITEVGVDAITEFASVALSRGMVYFCAWGRDCGRFHDVVDEVVVKDELGERRFVGPKASDVVVTTWHDNETLEEALDFFTTSAVPTEGFSADSSFRLVMCVDNPNWAETATRVLQSTKSLG